MKNVEIRTNMISFCKRKVRLVILMIICYFGIMNLHGQDLQKHKWENRILVLKSKKEDSIKYQSQIKLFENSIQELAERKLILYRIVNDKYELIDFNNPESKIEGEISPGFNEDVLSEHKDFELILIGLDGGVKLQKDEILLMKDLFGIIDSMPMRKQELRMNKLKN